MSRFGHLAGSALSEIPRSLARRLRTRAGTAPIAAALLLIAALIAIFNPRHLTMACSAVFAMLTVAGRRRTDGEASPDNPFTAWTSRTRTADPSAVEARLSVALAAISDGYWDWNIATGEVFYSPQYIRLLGYAPQEVPPRVEFFFSILHPEEVEKNQKAFEEHIAGRTQFKEIESRLRKKDGEYLQIACRARVVEWSETGKALRMIGSITDISDRKRTEETLRERVRTADFGRAIGVCLSQSDSMERALQGCCEVTVSALGVAFCGIWLTERGGAGVELRAHAAPSGGSGHTGIADAQRRLAMGAFNIGRIAARGQPYLSNDVLNDPVTGEGEWARRACLTSFAGYPMKVNGDVVGVAGVYSREPLKPSTLSALETAAGMIALFIRRAEAQEAARESDERMAKILASSLDAVVAIDSIGRVVAWNPSAEAMFGWSADEATGGRLSELIVPPSLREAHEWGIRKFLETGRSGVVGSMREITALRRDGTEFPIEIGLAAATFRGEPLFNAFIRDISERRRLEAELFQSRKLESIGQLAGEIVHDFNNFVTVIDGAARMAETRIAAGAPPFKELTMICEAAGKAASLTRQILAFSRKQVLSPSPVNINDVLSRLVDMIRQLTTERIEVALDLEDRPCSATVDAAQFEQVILNLVSNARDAMPKGGKLTIQTRNVSRESGDAVLISVSDTGHGMDEETRRRIFEPFFTTKAPDRGSGLGLAVVHGIVLQSGGEIRVESAPGQGARFSILLPGSPAAGPGSARW